MDISKIRKVRAVVNLRTDKKLYPIGTLFEAPFSPDIEAEIRSGSNTLQVEETLSEAAPVKPANPEQTPPVTVQPETPKRRGRRPAASKIENEPASQVSSDQTAAPGEGDAVPPVPETADEI